MNERGGPVDNSVRVFRSGLDKLGRESAWGRRIALVLVGAAVVGLVALGHYSVVPQWLSFLVVGVVLGVYLASDAARPWLRALSVWLPYWVGLMAVCGLVGVGLVVVASQLLAARGFGVVWDHWAIFLQSVALVSLLVVGGAGFLAVMRLRMDLYLLSMFVAFGGIWVLDHLGVQNRPLLGDERVAGLLGLIVSVVLLCFLGLQQTAARFKELRQGGRGRWAFAMKREGVYEGVQGGEML
jgi:hypothetical protein